MRLAIVLLLAALCVHTLGWWELGHMTTAQIAKFYLDSMNKTDAYNQFNQVITAFNNLTDGRSNTFIEAASWPDDIKEYNASFFDNYHFINIVYDPQFMFKNMSDLQRDINSVNILGWAMTVLRTNKHGITFERAFMARYLLHLLGDIHQPLHNTNMFTHNFTTGDLGGIKAYNIGNKINITLSNGTVMNLHGYMDSMAGQQQDGQPIPRPLNSVDRAKIQSLASSIMTQYPPQRFADLIKTTQFLTMAVQSYTSAVNWIYSQVLVQTKVSIDWETKMRKLCRQRIALGGYRLANLISLIYAN